MNALRQRGACGNPSARRTFIPIMDQRTDNERRQEAMPGGETRPAIAPPRKPQAWADWLTRRRRAVLVITALIIVVIVSDRALVDQHQRL